MKQVTQSRIVLDYWGTMDWRSLNGLIQHIWRNGWKPLMHTRLMQNLGIIMSSVHSLFFIIWCQLNPMCCIDNQLLSDVNYQQIKMFNVLIHSDLSGKTYNLIQACFSQELQMNSLYQVHSQIAKLSHVIEHTYNCCVNSCCCFVAHFASLNACPYCKEPCYKSDGQTPLQTFHYLPIGCRLKALYLNDKFSELLQYCSTLDLDSATIDNVFHGDHYHSVLQKRVQIDGQVYQHCYFSNCHDVTLGIMTNRFQVFKCPHNGSMTCWPIIAINFNLPPEECTMLSNILPLAIVPGPKAPKDYNSFLQPLVNEFKQLSLGD